jgi:hypothetical protein
MSWPEFLAGSTQSRFDVGGYHISLLGGLRLVTVVVLVLFAGRLLHQAWPAACSAA